MKVWELCLPIVCKSEDDDLVQLPVGLVISAIQPFRQAEYLF